MPVAPQVRGSTTLLSRYPRSGCPDYKTRYLAKVDRVRLPCSAYPQGVSICPARNVAARYGGNPIKKFSFHRPAVPERIVPRSYVGRSAGWRNGSVGARGITCSPSHLVSTLERMVFEVECDINIGPAGTNSLPAAIQSQYLPHPSSMVGSRLTL